MEYILLAFLLLIPVAARAATGEFHEIYSFWTIVWVSAWAIFGSIVSYANRLGRGEIQRFNLMELIGELATSAFAGWLTFAIARKSGIDQEMVYCLVGIAGHMGTRTMFFLDRFLEKFYDFAASKFFTPRDREDYQRLFRQPEHDSSNKKDEHDE